MIWMMRAISAPCRIASPRLRSEERRRISNRNRDFRRNRAWRRMRHNRTPREFPTRASVKVRTTAPGLQIGRTGKATAFPIVFRDRTGPSPSGLKVTGTTGTAAMVVRGISAHTVIPPPKPTRDGGADGAASPGLPPFITASPRPTNADTTTDAPLPDAVASSAPIETPEASPAVFEQPPGESGFPPRARRRRLRSPYGFSGGGSGESSGPNSTPEITDNSPVSE